MGEVIDFPQRVEPVDIEVETLIGQAEEGGVLVCVMYEEKGGVSLSFEPWPAGISVSGVTAMNRLTNRFRDNKDFREALMAYAWNVGAVYTAGSFPSSAAR